MVKKFEYKIIKCHCWDYYKIEDWLNNLGQQGWELFKMSCQMFYFKREKE